MIISYNTQSKRKLTKQNFSQLALLEKKLKRKTKPINTAIMQAQ